MQILIVDSLNINIRKLSFFEPPSFYVITEECAIARANQLIRGKNWTAKHIFRINYFSKNNL